MGETQACLNLGKSLGKTRGRRRGGGEGLTGKEEPVEGAPRDQVLNRCAVHTAGAGGEEGTGNCGNSCPEAASRCHRLHLLSLTATDYKNTKDLLQNKRE